MTFQHWSISKTAQIISNTQHKETQHNDIQLNNMKLTDFHYHYVQYNETLHQNIQHEGFQHCNKDGTFCSVDMFQQLFWVLLSCESQCHYDECHYAEYHYAEYHYSDCHYSDCHYAKSQCAETHHVECFGFKIMALCSEYIVINIFTTVIYLAA